MYFVKNMGYTNLESARKAALARNTLEVCEIFPEYLGRYALRFDEVRLVYTPDDETASAYEAVDKISDEGYGILYVAATVSGNVKVVLGYNRGREATYDNFSVAFEDAQNVLGR